MAVLKLDRPLKEIKQDAEIEFTGRSVGEAEMPRIELMKVFPVSSFDHNPASQAFGKHQLQGKRGTHFKTIKMRLVHIFLIE